MAIINVDDAYILNETGAQVDKTTGIPFKDEILTEAEAAQARANIRAGGTNPNLLDNPFFQVNQRSWATGSSNAYTVDRWRQYNCTTTVNADGSLTIASTGGGTFYENCPYDALLVGKTVTLSVLYTDGTVDSGQIVVPASGNQSTSRFSNNTQLGITTTGTSTMGFAFSVPANGSINVRAFKWELGTVSTLANDTPPDYGTELLKCMRYFLRLNYTSVTEPIGYGYAYSASQARIFIPTPVPMRANPTISATATANLRINSNGTYLTPSGFTATGTAFPNGIAVHFGISGATSGALALLFSYGPLHIDFSADL